MVKNGKEKFLEFWKKLNSSFFTTSVLLLQRKEEKHKVGIFRNQQYMYNNNKHFSFEYTIHVYYIYTGVHTVQACTTCTVSKLSTSKSTYSSSRFRLIKHTNAHIHFVTTVFVQFIAKKNIMLLPFKFHSTCQPKPSKSALYLP
jgi:hypothetical protein